MSADPRQAADATSNVVLRQLQGVRRELAAVLEREDRTQQLLVRLDQHMEARFQHVEGRLTEVRAAVVELRSDAVLQENRLLSRHNEILDILRRLDALQIAGEPDLGE